jgi:hypothetical protein
VQIYALIDPRDKTTFYVGATTRTLGLRLSSHRNDAVKLRIDTQKCDAIRTIEAAGERVQIAELETAHEDWAEAEQFWIGYLRFLGSRLTNIASGGPGATGSRQTEQTRQRRRDAATGRDMSQAHAPVAREKAASKLRHAVLIDGVRYDGIAVAARALGISHSLVHRRIDLGTYQRLTRRKNGNVLKLKGMRSGVDHPHSRPVEVDGVAYVSRLAACKALRISQSVMKTWILNGRAIFTDDGPKLQPRKRKPVKGRARGAKNFNSKAVLVDGQSFATIRDARAALGVSRKRLFKLIENGQAQFAV